MRTQLLWGYEAKESKVVPESVKKVYKEQQVDVLKYYFDSQWFESISANKIIKAVMKVDQHSLSYDYIQKAFSKHWISENRDVRNTITVVKRVLQTVLEIPNDYYDYEPWWLWSYTRTENKIRLFWAELWSDDLEEILFHELQHVITRDMKTKNEKLLLPDKLWEKYSNAYAQVIAKVKDFWESQEDLYLSFQEPAIRNMKYIQKVTAGEDIESDLNEVEMSLLTSFKSTYDISDLDICLSLNAIVEINWSDGDMSDPEPNDLTRKKINFSKLQRVQLYLEEELYRRRIDLDASVMVKKILSYYASTFDSFVTLETFSQLGLEVKEKEEQLIKKSAEEYSEYITDDWDFDDEFRVRLVTMRHFLKKRYCYIDVEGTETIIKKVDLSENQVSSEIILDAKNDWDTFDTQWWFEFMKTEFGEESSSITKILHSQNKLVPAWNWISYQENDATTVYW